MQVYVVYEIATGASDVAPPPSEPTEEAETSAETSEE
jgi:hypothetical protein